MHIFEDYIYVLDEFLVLRVALLTKQYESWENISGVDFVVMKVSKKFITAQIPLVFNFCFSFFFNFRILYRYVELQMFS